MHAGRVMINTTLAHHRNERPFALALAASLLVHAGIMMVSLPAAKRAPLASLIPLEVRLLAPEPPAAAEAPPPAPRRERPHPKPSPPAQQKLAAVEAATPSRLPVPAMREAPVEIPVPAPSEKPQAETAVAPPESQATAPPPVAKIALHSAPVHELLDGYGRSLSQLLARYKEYPRIAQMRGWEGSVTMRLRVAPTGRLVDATLQSSSGYEVLDQQALAMAHRPERLPAPPEGLRDGEISVLVPVVFRLARE
jgi:protein TonB